MAALYDIPLRKDKPKFVYAHLLAPHRPFVYGRNGEDIFVNLSEDLIRYQTEKLPQYKHNYRDQLLYLHDRLKEIVRVYSRLVEQ